MKKFKWSLAVMIMLAAFSSNAQWGDFEINISTLPAMVDSGTSAIYQVHVQNNGGTAYPAGKLKITAPAPINGKIIGFAPGAASGDWQIVSISTTSNPGGGGNVATLVNTVPLIAYYEAEPNLLLEGVTVAGVSTFLAKIDFSATDPIIRLADSTSYGNLLTANDDSQSSLIVNPPSSPTPLEFISIAAIWKSSDALVSWTVANEKNNEYFAIERSFDAKSFSEVGRIKSIGNHSNEVSYKYLDPEVKSKTENKVFYRIRQVDYNQKSVTSKIVDLIIHSDVLDAYVFPNPTEDGKISFVYSNASLKDDDMEIKILDFSGRIISKTTMSVKSGKNLIELNQSVLASGAYYLQYISKLNHIKGNIKFVKK